MYKSDHKARQHTKSTTLVDREFHGGGSLPAGIYDKLVIDSVQVRDNKLECELLTIDKNRHQIRWTMWEPNGAWTKDMRMLLAALLPSLECHTALLDIASNYKALQGLRLQCTINYKPGFRLWYTRGKYYCIDTSTEETIGTGHYSANGAIVSAIKSGHKRAKTDITEIDATRYADTNIRKFLNALHSTTEREHDTEKASMAGDKPDISGTRKVSGPGHSDSTGHRDDRTRPVHGQDYWDRLVGPLRTKVR